MNNNLCLLFAVPPKLAAAVKEDSHHAKNTHKCKHDCTSIAACDIVTFAIWYA